MNIRSSTLVNYVQILTTILSIIIAIVIPYGYFALSYNYLAGHLSAESELAAINIEALIADNPDSWIYEEIRMQEILERELNHESPESKTVTDLHGKILARVVHPQPWPIITKSQALFDSGRHVGTIEIYHSLLPLLKQTGIIGAGTLTFGIALFIIFHTFPLKAVRKAIAAREESDRFLRSTQAIARVCGWKANPHTNFLRLTDEFYDIYEASHDVRLTFEDWLKLFPPEDVLTIRQKLSDCIDAQIPFVMECKVTTQTGKPLWTELRGFVSVIEDGRPYAFGTLQDITARKMQEDALRESTEKFKAIADYSASWELWFNADGELVWMNSHAADATEYSLDESIHAEDYLSMVVAEEDLSIVKEKFRRALLGEMGNNFEIRVRRKNGTKFWVSVSWRPIFNADGHSMGVRISARDISQRKQTEADRERLIYELKEALEQIRTLKGIVPICCNCKKIRDDKGYWEQVEIYVSRHTEAEFSHALCPICLEKLYPGATDMHITS